MHSPDYSQYAPLYQFVHRLSRSEGRFYMPGHKGNAAALPGALGSAAHYDITEIPGADDLQHPEGPLAESQQMMARVYGSGATLYSASGSTACVQAMLTLFVGRGGRVVMGRNCHLAAVRALGMLGAEALWLQPVQGRVQPADVEAALLQSGAKAVYITSPDYYGRMADVAAIAAICHARGAALVVDNAHGAHLPFFAPDRHPLRLGADACCDSAHKTLPCLTPAAMLHLRDAALAGEARRALNLYSSTSPSYLVLQSLDLAAARLTHCPPDFAAAAAGLAGAAAACPAMVQPGDDPLRLTLWPKGAGADYAGVLAALRGAGLEPELCDGARVVLMASPFNKEEDFARLERVLDDFARDLDMRKGGQAAQAQAALEAVEGARPGQQGPVGAAARDAAGPAPLYPETPFALPEAVVGVRQALFAPHRRLEARHCVGHIAAEVAAPCPPGIPVVIPGERVSENAALLLAKGGISALDVVK